MIKLDLHFHSTYSDGKLSVPELAAIIKQEKLNYCALVDHNNIDGIRELEKCLASSGVIVIHGVELTAKYGKDEVHVLAYDFDINAAYKVVSERNELVRSQKIEEMKLAIELSQKEGLVITEGLAPLEKQPVTLTTALDICAKPVNQAFFLKRHGKELTPEDVYWEYQAPGKSCEVERSGVTVDWIVKKFKGIAQDLIIAHPFVSVSVVTKPLDELRINNSFGIGVTGVEVYHNQTTEEQIAFLKKLVNERGVHYTGGSDFHGHSKDSAIGHYGPDRDIPDFYLTNYSSHQKNKNQHD